MAFTILSIDGGGIRGVYPAHILKCLEERLGINLLSTFDLIAGTSTGSIIASAVAANVRASDIVTMYELHGQAIFKKQHPLTPSFALGLFESMYDSHSLDQVLTDVFKETELGQIKKPLLLPATDIGNGNVHVFKSGYSATFTRDNNIKVKDAVLASCSAPTFFDPHKVDSYLLSDGGLWANNPSLAAIIEAQKRLNIEIGDIKVLSIGTGHARNEYGVKKQRKWGFLNGWRKKEFINFILSLQSQSAFNYLKLLLRQDQ